MEVLLLGPVEVDGTEVRGREAAVLAALAARTPRSVSVDALIDDVWGDDAPLTAPKSLQNAISKLRRLLGTDAIETVENGYRLTVETDIARVASLRSAGRHSEALALWRGEPSAIPAGERVRLAELRAAIEDELAEAMLDAGEHVDAIGLLERWIAAEPYRERRWVLLTRALAAADRQADALRAVQRARTVFADELGLEVGDQLLAEERAVFARTADVPRARRSAPMPSTSFVGRDTDVERIRSLLARERLVTLTGPGGVGKTRLALAAVADRDSVFVDLAPASGPELVWEAVAAAAEIATQPGDDVAASVVGALDGLLVLDNCEHVLDAAADIADRVSATVLATSREPLGLVHELVVSVAPLAERDAVQLFLDRAGATGAIAVDDLDPVAEVCRRLDGLPLAIELAAARAPALDPVQLAARLDDRFALLDDRARRGEPRHRALRAVVDWSYDLLDADERVLFERLAVFRAPFRLEDAEAVLIDDRLPRTAVASAMTRLVRASMVTAELHGDGRRFRLLETFRAYADARLDDRETWQGRHLEWVAGIAREAGPQLNGPDQVDWFGRIGAVFDDVQAALEWCEDAGPASTGLEIATNLFHFWMGRARRNEGLRWLERFAVTATDVAALDRCRALYNGAMVAMMSDVAAIARLADVAQRIAGDRDSQAVADALAAHEPMWHLEPDRADPLIRRAVEILDEPQHAGTLPRLWNPRPWICAIRGDFDGARHWWNVAAAELAQMGDRHLYGGYLGFDADFAYAAGSIDEAAALAAEAIDIARDVRCPSCEAAALATIAITSSAAEEGGRLIALQRAVAGAASIGEVSGVIFTVPALAATIAGDDPDKAARLLGASDALRERTGHLMPLPGRARYSQPRLDDARSSVGTTRWDEIVEHGRTLSYASLLELASATR